MTRISLVLLTHVVQENHLDNQHSECALYDDLNSNTNARTQVRCSSWFDSHFIRFEGWNRGTFFCEFVLVRLENLTLKTQLTTYTVNLQVLDCTVHKIRLSRCFNSSILCYGSFVRVDIGWMVRGVLDVFASARLSILFAFFMFQ